MSDIDPYKSEKCLNHPDRRAKCLTANKGYKEWLCEECNKAKLKEWGIG